jgi:signal transduction histidine kinase
MATPRFSQRPQAKPDRRRLLRLSLDLHDGPMQDLMALGFSLDRLRREIDELPGDTEGLGLQVDGIREQLADIEVALREMASVEAHSARAATLGDLVAEEIARFRRLDDAELQLDIDETIEPETDSQRIALHRVLREALSNINKHAEAATVSVQLFEADEVIYLRVSDDGVGFDPAGGHGGLGLRGMQDRLRLLGSTLDIDSRPGGPTTVTAAGVRPRGGCAGGDPVAVVLGIRRRRTERSFWHHTAESCSAINS